MNDFTIKRRKEYTWDHYYRITENRNPSQLLIKAVKSLGKFGRALDLGSGTGIDAIYLLENGFIVTAVDMNNLSIERLSNIQNSNLTVIQSSFDTFSFGIYDIVNASWSLPFNSKESFNSMFVSLKQSILPGGYFSGHLFGINDTWNTIEKNMTFHTKKQVEEIFSDMNIINLQEIEKDGTTANGTPKHWHVFHILAQKKII